MYTFDDNIISDLHKDARGYRPTQDFWAGWVGLAPSGKQEIWDMLVEEMKLRDAEEQQSEAYALVEFRKLVRKTMDFCGTKWTKAVEFLCDAEGDDINCEQGFDYFLWKQGIGYQDRANIRKLFKEAV